MKQKPTTENSLYRINHYQILAHGWQHIGAGIVDERGNIVRYRFGGYAGYFEETDFTLFLAKVNAHPNMKQFDEIKPSDITFKAVTLQDLSEAMEELTAAGWFTDGKFTPPV